MAKKQKPSIDTVYFLKLLLYLILGSLWIKVSGGQTWQFAFPIGLAIGVVFTTHEHFAIDRKIEYAILLVAMLIGYWAPFGIYITV